MNSKTLQKIISASLIGSALLLCSAANASVVPNRIPLLGYCDHAIAVYKAPNVSAGISLYKETFIQIRSIRLMNGVYWGYGAFPVTRGKVVNGWLKMSDFQNVSFKNYDGTITSAQSVYRIPDNIGTYNGVVENGEKVLVIGSQGNLLQIIYKQKNSANWRIGWVAVGTVQKTQSTTIATQQTNTSTNTASSTNANVGKLVLVEHPVLTKTTNAGTSANTNHTTVNTNTINKNPVINPAQRNRMKGDFDGDGKIGITDVSKINSHVIGLEKLSQEDLTIADINEDGKIDGDDVAIVKNVNIGMDSIANYKTNYSRWNKIAARTVAAYNEPSLKQKRDRNVNERVDKGDNVTVFSETSNAYYVEYPAGNVRKKRWVSKDIFVADTNATINKQTSNAASQGINNTANTGKQVAQGTSAGINAAMQAAQRNQASVFKSFTATAKRTVNAYDNSALTNWDGKSRVDYNDTITATKEEGNAYFVRYPIRTAPYYKEKWVTKEVLKEEPKPVLTNVQSKLMYEVYRTTNGPKITCDFDGYVNTKGRHEGIDMSLYHNAPVYATISGEITKAGGDKFNTFAIYDKANNKTVVYLHFNSVATGLRVGNYVNRGTLIGYQGSTGASASHVHIEVRNNRVAGAAKSVDDPILDNPNPYSYWNSVL